MSKQKKLDSPEKELRYILDCVERRAQTVNSAVGEIIALLPDIDTRIAEMVSPDEAREAIKEAREQGEKKALRRILKEGKFLSPYELIAGIKQSLKGE